MNRLFKELPWLEKVTGIYFDLEKAEQLAKAVLEQTGDSKTVVDKDGFYMSKCRLDFNTYCNPAFILRAIAEIESLKAKPETKSCNYCHNSEHGQCNIHRHR